MIKKIEIAGIQLDNYTVGESIEQVDIFMNSTEMNTIEEISMEQLVLAGEDELLRTSIESLDLTIINDPTLLRTAGVTSPQRKKEAKEGKFFEEFLKRILRNRKNVYLVGAENPQVDALKEFLQEYYEGIQITGSLALEDCGGDGDNVVNEINTLSPDVVFSVLPTPKQEYFLQENRSRMNAKIWYGISQDYAKDLGKSRVKKWMRRLLHKGMLRQMVAEDKQKQ